MFEASLITGVIAFLVSASLPFLVGVSLIAIVPIWGFALFKLGKLMISHDVLLFVFTG
jgi:hypothetical protein